MNKKDTKLNEHSVKVNNRNLKTGEELFTTRELYLYSFLETRTNIRGLVETSLSLINRKIKFVKTEYRNKKIIKETLESLQDKIAINIVEEDGEIYDIEMFEIEDNFTFVEYSKVEELREEELFIYTIVKRFEDYGEYSLSYSRWSELLQCSKSHAINTVNKAVENKVIYKKVNNYTDKTINNQKIQETSTYSLNPFAKDIKSEEESQEDTGTSADDEPLVVQSQKEELQLEQPQQQQAPQPAQVQQPQAPQQNQPDTSQSQNQNGLSDINAMLEKELNGRESQEQEVESQNENLQLNNEAKESKEDTRDNLSSNSMITEKDPDIEKNKPIGGFISIVPRDKSKYSLTEEEEKQYSKYKTKLEEKINTEKDERDSNRERLERIQIRLYQTEKEYSEDEARAAAETNKSNQKQKDEEDMNRLKVEYEIELEDYIKQLASINVV